MFDLQDFFKYKQVVSSLWDKKINNNTEETYNIHYQHTNENGYMREGHPIIKKYRWTGSAVNGTIELGPSPIIPYFNFWYQTSEYNDNGLRWGDQVSIRTSDYSIASYNQVVKRLYKVNGIWYLRWFLGSSHPQDSVVEILLIYMVHDVSITKPVGYINFALDLNSLHYGSYIKSDDYDKNDITLDNQKTLLESHKTSFGSVSTPGHLTTIPLFNPGIALPQNSTTGFYTLSESYITDEDIPLFFVAWKFSGTQQAWSTGAYIYYFQTTFFDLYFPVVYFTSSTQLSILNRIYVLSYALSLNICGVKMATP